MSLVPFTVTIHSWPFLYRNLSIHSAETVFLVGLHGTEVTTDTKKNTSALSDIDNQKLEETSLLMTHKDINNGLGPLFAAVKFLCYRNDDRTKKPAFLRMYQQMSIAGTDFPISRT
ncbi:uncharacterized protein N7479_002239 [Penicillium vulpinum]|uniref:Uncharacterized protein n=1 Tax=Penicillium vulpinum TaxID=29845 RepID=A0A1V6S8A1_9EURO|nr:uncharacterized protein N7479_002239 [Penicillium vulpinum]KAJ5972321.1 hypothetical protein N7479_002239 [Penicillium vulpinum]OQE09833.1 hypothetical protein PENVUL_c005G03622 [Penicillium vulpinum]